MKTIYGATFGTAGSLRRYMLQKGINFKEDKGWFSSDFYINCKEEQFAPIRRAINEYNK